MSVYGIGDLHACLEELEVLLAALAAGPDDTLVFLGDYIDRGTRARDVVDRLIRLQTEGPTTVFLRGNHEDMLLSYLDYPGHHGSAYLSNGGTATLESYGIPSGLRGRRAAERFPEAHLQFLLSLQMSYVHEAFLFVHAGVRPGVALEDQRDEDLLWIREEFFTQRHEFPYTVVFGHTPHREARIDLPYKVGLDTGLVYGNKLSCLDVTGRRLLQVARGSTETVVRDLAPAFDAAARDRSRT